LDSENASTSYDESLLNKADFLQVVLTRRLEKHVQNKIDESKQRHWCVKFEVAALGTLASIMVLLDQVKDDLEMLDETECLLKGPGIHSRIASAAMNEDGVYIYWCTNNHRYVRVGMVAGREFWRRGDEHKKGSLLKGTSLDSRFYRHYPDKSVADQVKNQRQGLHNNLQQRVLLGAPVDASCADLADIFGLDSDSKVQKKMHKINKNKSNEENLKRSLHYALEMAYGLCLNPLHNVSQNPGWEQALKIYG
jgi:hypothetical protein